MKGSKQGMDVTRPRKLQPLTVGGELRKLRNRLASAAVGRKMRLDAEQIFDSALNPEVVEVTSLKTWSLIPPLPLGPVITPGPHSPRSPFPCDPKLNDKIVLWVGDISLLNVDAIVNSTNESMLERNSVSDRIYSQAGQGLLEEIKNEIKECKTGDVQVTSGHNLPARYIIHTVGPKYNIKYQTAAENSLHSCYRNVLQKACELGVNTIAIPAINSVKRNYPPDQGAHIALRTVRRFLDKYSSCLDKVVLTVENSDAGIYELLLPLYFPRTEQEEFHAARQLPNCVGGLDGEPLLPDRQIRIIDNPHHLHDEESLSTQLEGLGVGEHAFSQMQGDLDQQRLLGDLPTYNTEYTSESMMREMQNNISYDRLLRRARTEDLSEISGIGCLYQSGVDRFGRPVIVFVGKWFKFNEINLEKALLYLIYLLDPLVKGDYVITYFHTMTGNNNYPSFNWLKEVYNILPYKYKKNLKAFYIVHPTFWTKMMTWWFTTFMAPAIKQKVFSLPGVEYLYTSMTPDQLEIPAFITEYDMTINGIRYVSASESG
ncbi:protein GDAP2 homolog isoform X2 [Cloeon dipterum]|uniref:protein GDAP2 homolog isoform X2 n=1 Tax=Cloeon dipterum TaxID=197152 RepID=UPI0032207BBE